MLLFLLVSIFSTSIAKAQTCDIIILDIENTTELRIGQPANIYVEIFNNGDQAGNVQIIFEGLNDNVYSKSSYFSPNEIKRIYFNNILPSREGYVEVVARATINCAPPVDDERREIWFVSGAVTYTVTFTQSGLPANTLWSVTLGSVTRSSTTSSISFNVAAGTYSWSVSEVSCGAGCRYMPNPASGTISVPSQLSQSINFVRQFQVSFSTNPINSGTTSPTGSNWYNSGQTINIIANPNPGYSFSHWHSSTSLITINNINSASTTATINGPGIITANFNLISSCSRQNPSVTISPSSQTGNPGQTLTYTVYVTNNDNSACGSSTFTLTNTCPSGFTCSLSSSSLTISPGSTSSTSISVTSSSSSSPGTYTFSVTATNNADSTKRGTGSASYVVISQPFDFSLSVSPSSLVLHQGEVASLVVTLDLISGTSKPVNFSIASPPGISATISPSSCSPSCSAVLSVVTTTSTSPGTYYLVLVATGSVKTITIPITVLEAFQVISQPIQFKPKQEITYPIEVRPQAIRLEEQPTKTIEIVSQTGYTVDLTQSLFIIILILIIIALITLIWRFLPIFARRRKEPEDP